MTVVRANFLPEFDFGDDAVLLTLDRPGAAAVLGALRTSIGTGSSKTIIDGVVHDIAIIAGRAHMQLRRNQVTWQLDHAKAAEIASGLTVLHDSDSARGGHIYVDIQHPAPTLVLSRDEYLHMDYPWIEPPSDTATPQKSTL
ncbi:hypothetical protein [Mycolicibacterium sp. S3B2]|uniref:hypothetical protein n=1 Tax=Mycolicibacterium sp. S3B2 TaxID=3415120 RepID=UPI003C7A4064